MVSRKGLGLLLAVPLRPMLRIERDLFGTMHLEGWSFISWTKTVPEALRNAQGCQNRCGKYQGGEKQKQKQDVEIVRPKKPLLVIAAYIWNNSLRGDYLVSLASKSFRQKI